MSTPIINIFTYGLPYKLANQIYKEFQDRLKDVHFLIENSIRFNSLVDYKETVELLLALSIFHKRVVSNLDGAVKFYGTVNKYSQADTISMGSYDLTVEEKNKFLGLLINYRVLIKKFGISEVDFDYNETKDFLSIVKQLKNTDDYAETKQNKNSKGRKDKEDDLPF
ncbi:MAG: hypothetical protein ACYCZ2_02865 [Lutibacter sp.]